ncbi:MAG: helix-turn-helix domain-containing protein [Chitinophagaceae bacterium]|nr:helix-turn-helix domain-containing protein [Chitinophagaceae bacterium]
MFAATPHLLLVFHAGPEPHLPDGYLADTYHLLTARTESNVVRILEDQAIHLIIIDASPGSSPDGNKLCARLKCSPHFAHIPVILLITANDQEARMSCLESGADAWAEKPLSRDYLRAQIRNLVANRARVKDHFSRSALAHMHPMACSGENETFLSRLNGYISDHLPDIDLNVDVLARLMNMSRPTLYRRIKCISELTPNELINKVRLEKAAGLLAADDHKIFEIVKMVGFNSRSNFGKAFVKHFGVTPREFQQMTKSS